MFIKRFLSRLKLYFYLVFSKRQHGIITFQISKSDQRKVILGEEYSFNIYFSGVDSRVIDKFKKKLNK